jgi:lysozyme family protein
MTPDFKQETILKIVGLEGGYVDDPSDSGGATMYGVTERVARACGYAGAMRDLPKETAVRIYERQYWTPLRLDEVGAGFPDLAELLMDTAVNMGAKKAATLLQRCLNALNGGGTLYPDVAVDGGIGGRTLSSLGAYVSLRGEEGKAVLLLMFVCLRGARYVELAEKREKDERFVYGWFRRMIETIAI